MLRSSGCRIVAPPLVIACVIALPLLTSVMNFMGMLGGFAAETTMTGMPLQTYFRLAFSSIQFSDLIPATLKTAVFGFIIATVASYLGVNTSIPREERRAAAVMGRGTRADAADRRRAVRAGANRSHDSACPRPFRTIGREHVEVHRRAEAAQINQCVADTGQKQLISVGGRQVQPEGRPPHEPTFEQDARHDWPP